MPIRLPNGCHPTLNKPYKSGWGARVADLFYDTCNNSNPTSMLITAAGNNKFMNGSQKVSQYSVTSTGAISLASFGSNYGDAKNNPDGPYLHNSAGERLTALEGIMQYSHAHILEKEYSKVVSSALENEAIINEAIKAENNTRPRL